MCVTRPPTCATQLEMGSNSLLRICTLPCMSATMMPYDEDAIAEIEVPTRRIWGLSARSCASLTGTTSKNGNCLHCETYQRESGSRSMRLTPGAEVVGAAAVGLEGGVEDESIDSKARPRTAGRKYRSRHYPKNSHTQPNRRRSRTAHSSLNSHILSTHPWRSLVSESGLHP